MTFPSPLQRAGLRTRQPGGHVEIQTERFDLPSPPGRPRVVGKFLFANGRKLFVRGATYGTFRPDENGRDFPPRELVERDFREMVDNGFNSIRVYSIPPGWLLDLAARAGLWVMVGVPWEQHILFLEDRQRVRAIEARVRAGVRSCAAHPAVLGYAVGNEIPPSIVRWAGRHRVERHIRRHRLYASGAAGADLGTTIPAADHLHGQD